MTKIVLSLLSILIICNAKAQDSSSACNLDTKDQMVEVALDLEDEVDKYTLKYFFDNEYQISLLVSIEVWIINELGQTI